MDDGICCDDLPPDAFVEILLHLPPSARRRSRLVCRRWRHAIDAARTPEERRQCRSKPLVFFRRQSRANSQEPSSAAHVFDDLYSIEHHGGISREIWNSGTAAPTAMFGCCNGLVSLWDEGSSRITILNPLTGETLSVQPPPRRGVFHHAMASFGYHPITGKYKIVHIPIEIDDGRRIGRQLAAPFDAVEVLTLGDGDTWREVAPPPLVVSRSHIKKGVVTVDGATYWVTTENTVMSFDLEHERITPVKALPAMSPGLVLGHLAVVGGRLGAAMVCCTVSDPSTTIVKVWVLEGGRDDQIWVRRYNIQGLVQNDQHVVWPYFCHGRHVLTAVLYKSLHAHQLHHLIDGSSLALANLHTDPKVAEYDSLNIQAFPYVEATEPLSDYVHKQTPHSHRVADLGSLLSPGLSNDE